MFASNRPELALIALGSNLGERRATIDLAVERLRLLPESQVERVSSAYETEPIGGPVGQGPFLNAAVLLKTALGPRRLFEELQRIEVDLGRIRVEHWGERILDLDLILYGREIFDDGRTLVVPHPRMAHRAFVLEPAAEIAPSLIDPKTGRTLLDLRDNLRRRPSYVAVVGPIGPGRDRLLAEIIKGLEATPIIGLRASGDSLFYAGPPPGPAPEFFDQFHQSLDCLKMSHWPESDTWVVSDFWIDQFYISAQLQFSSNTCKILPLRDTFLAARPTLLAPTLVALWDPPLSSWKRHLGSPDSGPDLGEWNERGWKILAESWSRLRRAYDQYRETRAFREPIVIIDNEDPIAAATEIMVACR